MAESSIQQAQEADERLRHLYELALTVAGDPIQVFDQIVRIIAELFGVRVALVEKLEGEKIITLSMYLDGRILHDGVFELAGTPCANVRETRSFCAFSNAASVFPQDAFLRDFGIEFYIGVPVVSSGGEVIAIINAMHEYPIHINDDDRLFLEAMASRVRLELEREQQAEANRLKTEVIAELSTPVIPVWDRVLLAPIIGTLNRERAEALTEALLNKSTSGGADVVILDITGVRIVDTDAAEHLHNTVTALGVLGAQCIITGVGAAVAQTLVQLGITLEGMRTRRRLSDGLQLALDIINSGQRSGVRGQ